MRRALNILVRALFIIAWFAMGYFPYDDFAMGLFSAICAFVLMEICYTVDRKTSGFDKIMSRLSYLDETLDESQKTENLILEELMIDEENIKGDSQFEKGEKEGIEIAKKAVEHRFDEVFEALKEKQSKGGQDK